ncbi:MAG: RsmB/NOP family class I SAM-dependent RNA methyltransferase [Victivallaceae bacterium]
MGSADGRAVPPAAGILDAAVSGLTLWEEKNRSLDDYLAFDLRHPEFRRSVGNLLTVFFRRKRVIDSAIRHHAARPPRDEARRILEIALAQCMFQTGAPREVMVFLAVEKTRRELGVGTGNFVNALLRKVLAEPPEITDEPKSVLPTDLWRRWKKLMPRKIGDLTRTFLATPPSVCRACGGFVPKLEELNFDFTGGYRFYRVEKPGELLASADFEQGLVYMQDPAAALAPSMLEFTGGEHVCDLCAAPGGKALMIAEKLNKDGLLVMYDRSEVRQKLTRENFSRRRLEAQYRIEVADARDARGSFDAVLCDVPCSNTGVFRRRPDALWRQSEEHLAELVALQKNILDAAAKLVKPGGRLVYSTCSIEPEENGLQAAAFMARHPEFKIEKQRQIYPETDHDGAYAALLTRQL